jgi:hypothetical protein
VRAFVRSLPLALVLALASCGGDAERPAAAAKPRGIVDSSKEPPYVSALDANPRDGSLLMATNLGLFRIAPEGRGARRVDARVEAAPRPVAVGRAGLAFTFTGPDRLIGSGHPDRAGALPESLGLLLSEDGGRSWRSLSRMGQSDFHALHLVEGTLVAADLVTYTVMVSPDGGRTWKQRPPPEPLFDLEVDPRDPEALAASSRRGFFTSDDGGRTWRPRETAPFALLEWTREGRLHRADQDGTLRESADGGASWRRVGATRSAPQALAADPEGDLYVAAEDGSVDRSKDGGRTWAPHFREG